MTYISHIITILPCIFDYLDDPFELIATCKLINTHTNKYKIRFVKHHAYSDIYRPDDIDPHRRFFNKQLLQKFKFKQLELIDNIKTNIDNSDDIFLKHIEEIQINNDYFHDEGMIHLTNAKKIVLNINGDDLFGGSFDVHNNFSMNSLKFINNLHTLNIFSDTINDNDLKFFKNITHLDLKINNNITDEGLYHLQNIKTLVLEDNTQITDKGLKYLKNIKKLSLDLNTNINGIGFVHLKNIKFLKLWELFTENKYLKNLYGIEELYLSRENLTNSSLRYLTGIKILSLPRNNIITDRGMKYIGGLEELCLQDNYNITNRGLKYLFGIKKLMLMHCQIKNSTMKYLRGIQELIIFDSSIENTNLKMLDGIKILCLEKLTIVNQNIGIHPFDQLDELNIEHIKCDYLNTNVIKSIRNTKNMRLNNIKIKRNGELFVENFLKFFNNEFNNTTLTKNHTQEWKQNNNKINTFLKEYYSKS